MSPYDPAINTTESMAVQDLRLWLDKATEAAVRSGNIGIIGFIVVQAPDGGTVFEPFSSSRSLTPQEFVDLVATGARGMMDQETVN